MEPINYLNALRSRWKLLVACFLVAVIAAVVTAPAHPKASRPIRTYEATATLISLPGNGSTSSAFSSNHSTAFTAFFVTTGEVPKRAAKIVHYTGDPAVLASGVSVTTNTDVGSVSIAYSNNHGPYAAAVANAFAHATIAYFRDQAQSQQQQTIQNLQAQIKHLGADLRSLSNQISANPHNTLLQAQHSNELSQYGAAAAQLNQLLNSPPPSSNLSVLQKATPIPQLSGGFTPPSGRGSRTLIGAVLGLLIGVGLVLLLERFDTRIRTRAGALRALRVPVLTEIPRLPWRSRRRPAPIVTTEPASPGAEAYRALRSSLMLLPSRPISLPADLADSVDAAPPTFRAPKVLLVTSARSREGKTTTVANLAACLAETGKSVLVLDCDFRNPEAHLRLLAEDGPGLSDIITTGSTLLEPLIRRTGIDNVRLVTAGTHLEHPGQLATRMAALVHEARNLADVVLVDSSPVLQSNDALDLMPHVDSVLVVLRSGRVTSDQAERLSELLARLRVPIIGSAFIGSRQPHSLTSRLQGGGSYSYGRAVDRLTGTGVNGSSAGTPAKSLDQG
jgi:capsular exopolysaccharide synthesis family protein